MKKLLLILALLINTQAFAFENTLPVKKVIFDLGRYTNSNKIEKIKSLYSPEFISGDGFKYDTFFKMVEETFESYDDIKIKTKINDIDLNGDSATVSLVDTTSAKLINQEDIANYGSLNGVCNYVINMKKIDGKWKIVSDRIIEEQTSLKYGAARAVKMEVFAPKTIKEGSEYSIILKMDTPKNGFVIASLDREGIVYPPAKPDEAYRKLPSDGELERIVRANKIGLNEYAVASVGFSSLQLGENLDSIEVQMSGLAFLTSRVNIEKSEAK